MIFHFVFLYNKSIQYNKSQAKIVFKLKKKDSFTASYFLT